MAARRNYIVATLTLAGLAAWWWREELVPRRPSLASESIEDAATQESVPASNDAQKEKAARSLRPRLWSGVSEVELERGQALDYKRLRIAERSHRFSEVAKFRGLPLKSGSKIFYVMNRHGATSDPTRVPSEVEWSREKGGYWIYKLASSDEAEARPPLPLVVNEATGRFGVVTGQILLTPRKMADLQAIVQDQGLELVQRFDHLRWASLKVRAGVRIFEKYEKLLNDPRVGGVELNILENDVRATQGKW